MGQKNLTGISHYAHCRGALRFPNTQHKDVTDEANEVIDAHEAESFTMKETNCDKEFRKAMGLVSAKRGIKMNCQNSNDHAPREERSNRTTEEQARALHH